MSNKKLSAVNFHHMFGSVLLKIESLSATITDNRKAVMLGGVPNGYVDGDVACSGDIELDSENFNLLLSQARTHGSWQDIPAQNFICNGSVAGFSQRFELFGVILNIADLLNHDGKGGEKTKHKITFEVTSPDFVKIDGIPYLSADRTADLIR